MVGLKNILELVKKIKDNKDNNTKMTFLMCMFVEEKKERCCYRLDKVLENLVQKFQKLTRNISFLFSDKLV